MDWMFVKEWEAQYQGHRIVVRNHWFKGVHLHIDGVQRAHNKQMFGVSAKRPIISVPLRDGDATAPTVEIYVAAVLRTLAAIVVGGVKIAGDLDR